MKKLSLAVVVFAAVGVSFAAQAETIATNVIQNSNGFVSKVVLTDESAKPCDAEYPGSKYAAMDILSAPNGKWLGTFHGCYAMREAGVLSISFLEGDSGKWISYMSDTSFYEKTPQFKAWPGQKTSMKHEVDAKADGIPAK